MVLPIWALNGLQAGFDPLSCAAVFSHNQPPLLTPGVLPMIISLEQHDLHCPIP